MKLLILGRQPQLSLAELISLYGDKVQAAGQAAALLDDESVKFDRLGGSLKLGRVMASFDGGWPAVRAYLLDQANWAELFGEDTRLTIGLSYYDRVPPKYSQFGLELKSALKAAGKSVRIVPSATAALNAASLAHNRLTSRGRELLVVITSGRSYLAVTEQFQDVDAYAARDHARPSRSAKVGMLPPKLAQIMLNLAKPPAGGKVLDPFCGTGVVLQEALLAGYSAIGSDVDPTIIKAATDNLEWLAAAKPLPQYELKVADAIRTSWPKVDAVVTEGYLGPPLFKAPSPADLTSLKTAASQLTLSFLQNLHPQIKSGTAVVISLPAWRVQDSFKRLEIVDQITELGYTFTQFASIDNKDLIYWRPGQIVGRELVVLRSN